MNRDLIRIICNIFGVLGFVGIGCTMLILTYMLWTLTFDGEYWARLGAVVLWTIFSFIFSAFLHDILHNR